MKKIILSVLVTLGVAAIAGGLLIMKINDEHRAELDRLKVDYQIEIDGITNEHNNVVKDYIVVINELNGVNEEINELYEQVWNMQNGEAYEVRIEHDGETHYWESDNKGIFSSVSHTVIY